MVNKWNVYVTRILSQEPVDRLEEECKMEVNPEDRMLAKEELLEKVKGKDGVLCNYADKIDDKVLEAASPTCKIFANCAAGYDNIDIDIATKKGIYITNTPDINTETTADMAWGLIFAVARRIVEGDRFTRVGIFKGYTDMQFLGLDVTGKTLGIIGAGRIGSAVGKKARGFDMKLLCCDVKPNERFKKDTGADYVGKETLLKESDFISLHVPLVPSTKHLIGKKEFKIMKKTAILINTSRGPVVDEIALAKALKEGEIWGAGLDVYEWEPNVTSELKEMDNVVILPHIASATVEVRYKTVMKAVENILAALKGEIPPNCVNRQKN